LFLSIQVYFARICPRSADVLSGHIYPLQVHGGFVYLTQVQHGTIAMMTAIWVIVVIFCAIGFNRIRSKEKNE